MNTHQFVHSNEWRDPAGVNALLMRASFPSTAVETMEYWKDLISLDRTVVFDRAMIVSRETSGREYVASPSFLLLLVSSHVSLVPAH